MPVRTGEGPGVHPEHPLRQAELGIQGRDGARHAGGDVVAVQIPPAAPVGNEDERGAVGRPFRLKDRFGGTAGDRRSIHEQRRAVPRHVRVVPREICQAAVARQFRRGEEIVARREDLRSRAVDGDDLVDRLAARRCDPRERRSSGRAVSTMPSP